MKTRSHFLIQTLIFFIPALIATLLFQINPYFTSPIEEFAWYRCGLSGLFLMYYLAESLSISDTLAAIIGIFIYSVVFLFFCYLSKSSKKRMVIMNYVNIALAVWGVFSGTFYMFAAMQ